MSEAQNQIPTDPKDPTQITEVNQLEAEIKPLSEAEKAEIMIKNDDSFVNDIVEKAVKKLEKKGRTGRKEDKKDEQNLNESEAESIFNLKNLIALCLIGIAGVFFYAYSKIEAKEKQNNEN